MSAQLAVHRRIGRALLLLILYAITGIPVVIALAIESAAIAWVADDLLGLADFDTVGLWAFIVQLGLVLLFTMPPLLGAVVKLLRTGELPARTA